MRPMGIGFRSPREKTPAAYSTFVSGNLEQIAQMFSLACHLNSFYYLDKRKKLKTLLFNGPTRILSKNG